MKLKSFAIALLFSCSTVLVSAQSPSELTKYVEALSFDCPVDLGNGWVAQSYDINDNNVIITIIGDFPDSYFNELGVHSDSIKAKFLNGAGQINPAWQQLLSLTCGASSTLVIDLLSSSGAATVEIVCSPSEIADALK